MALHDAFTFRPTTTNISRGVNEKRATGFASLWLSLSLAACSPPTAPSVAPGPQTPTQAVTPVPPADTTPSTGITAAQPVRAIPAPMKGDIGRAVPTAFVAASPSGHWAVVCEATEDNDNSGDLAVHVDQHGHFTGDRLRQVLYLGEHTHDLDEYAGSDPSGRFVAFVRQRKLVLFHTASATQTTLDDADTRATQASFQALRSVSFSDDGQWIAYAANEKNVVVRSLTTDQETTYTIAEPLLYRLRFAPGGRFLVLEVITTDSNKNGKLQWLTPERIEPAPCPSPIPTYNVWQFPGDTPETRLLDTKTGNLISPEGYALAAGNVYVERRPDQGLLVSEPGKAVRQVSTTECAGRVMHVDLATGNVVFGCASAWGQRRQIFLRTKEARVALEFDLAAFELDTRLDTSEPNIAFYPGNRTLIFNVRTRERWPLLDGTKVLTIGGNTALIEQNQKLQLIGLNPDGSSSELTQPIPRPEFSSMLVQASFVSVGDHVFHLTNRGYEGSFQTASSPLALSTSGQGLYPTKPATPTTLSAGPLRWVEATAP